MALIEALKSHADSFRELHRRWDGFNQQNQTQFDTLANDVQQTKEAIAGYFDTVMEHINTTKHKMMDDLDRLTVNLTTARDDSIKDYQTVLDELAKQINAIDGAPQ